MADRGKNVTDHWLPYVLFAYRAVPQVSIGFFPFELLYGRWKGGPLDVLRDSWVMPKEPTTSSALAYVLAKRDKMEEMAKLVKVKMKQVQQRQNGLVI